MCVVSMVTDHYMRQYPDPYQISPKVVMDFLELVRKAEEYDRVTLQPNCPSDDKLAWLEKVRLSWPNPQIPPVNLNTLGPSYRVDWYQGPNWDQGGT